MLAKQKQKIKNELVNAVQYHPEGDAWSKQDTLNLQLYQYWYYKNVETIVKKLKDKSLKELTDNLIVEQKLERLVKMTSDQDCTQEENIITSDLMVLNCKTRTASKSIDKSLLIRELHAYGIPAAEIEQMLKRSEKTNAVAKVFEVMEVGEQNV